MYMEPCASLDGNREGNANRHVLGVIQFIRTYLDRDVLLSRDYIDVTATPILQDHLLEGKIDERPEDHT